MMNLKMVAENWRISDIWLLSSLLSVISYHEVESACSYSNLYEGSTNVFSNGYTFSPRPGVWYFVLYFRIGCCSYPGYDVNRCPSGTSLAYIKTATEWQDWKYLAGNVQTAPCIYVFDSIERISCRQ